MTVGELKEILNRMEDDQRIIITSQDPTGWEYLNDCNGVEEGCITIDEMDTYTVDKDEVEWGEEDEDNPRYERVVLIDGGDC